MNDMTVIDHSPTTVGTQLHLHMCIQKIIIPRQKSCLHDAYANEDSR